MAGRYSFRGHPLFTIGARLPSLPQSPPLFSVHDPVPTPREESNKEGDAVPSRMYA